MELYSRIFLSHDAITIYVYSKLINKELQNDICMSRHRTKPE